MNFGLLFRTISHLKPIQIAYQLRNRIYHPGYRQIDRTSNRQLRVDKPIGKPVSYQKGQFTFLNLTSPFRHWNDSTYGMLWAYNLNYMDWLLQNGMTSESGVEWIDRFISDLPQNKVGLDPYPIALRALNWIKFFSLHPETRSAKRDATLYSQYDLLLRKIEYHLLGNHLLEDAFSLVAGGIYFDDRRLLHKGMSLLQKELEEQILDDGAHFEQSPMYHAIMLDRLLDIINLVSNNRPDLQTFTHFLSQKASLMLGHLQSITFADGTLPLFGDAAHGIAPAPSELFDYAQRLGLKWQAIPLGGCGYRKMIGNNMEVLVDVGNIMATYQPGHAHADTFTYELRRNSRPLVVDTGISTYNKTERRLYERSTAAHNTVVAKSRRANSSEIWSGFRMGRRAHVTILEDTHREILAVHGGFGKNKLHTRRFKLTNNVLEIEDTLSRNHKGISYIHLAPDISIIRISNTLVETNKAIFRISGASKIEQTQNEVSTEYNRFEKSVTLKLYFNGHLTYTVEPIDMVASHSQS